MVITFSKPGSFFKAFGQTWTAQEPETIVGHKSQRWTSPACLYSVRYWEADSRYTVSVNPAYHGTAAFPMLDAMLSGQRAADRSRMVSKAIKAHESVMAGVRALALQFPATAGLDSLVATDEACKAAAEEESRS